MPRYRQSSVSARSHAIQTAVGRLHRSWGSGCGGMAACGARLRTGRADAEVAFSSYAAIPRAITFTVKVLTVREDDLRQIFGVFVAQVAAEPKANRSAVVRGQWIAIHAIGKKRLRMESVRHVDIIPQYAHNARVLIAVRKWNERDVPGLRAGLDNIQHMGKPHARPFSDIGPPLLAGMQHNVTLRRQALQLFERK